MNTEAGWPTASRVRLLLIALLGAAIWVALSILGSSTAASAANEPHDTDDLIPSSITGILDPLPVVPEVVSGVISGTVPDVASAAASAAPISHATVTVDEAATHAATTVREIIPATVTATIATVDSAGKLLGSTVGPVLDQPLVASAVDWLTGNAVDVTLATDNTVGDASAPAVIPPTAVAVGGFADAAHSLSTAAAAGPAAAKPSSAAGFPRAPSLPVGSASFDAIASGQGSAAQPFAAIFGSASTMTFAAGTSSAQNDALPSSATFDTDCSPD